MGISSEGCACGELVQAYRREQAVKGSPQKSQPCMHKHLGISTIEFRSQLASGLRTGAHGTATQSISVRPCNMPNCCSPGRHKPSEFLQSRIESYPGLGVLCGSWPTPPALTLPNPY